MTRPRGRRFVAGLVLAAGGSTRLGQPKQLLPFAGRTLLDHVLATARASAFDQLLCVVGGGAGEVRRQVDFDGVGVVENARFGEGCSSSIAAALAAVDRSADLLVIMLGDQPGVEAGSVRRLVDGIGDAPLGACAYEDGRGHPLAFAHRLFGELRSLHGDKGVWKLVDRYESRLAEVQIAGPVPLDVDTWEDYRRVLAQAVTVSPGSGS